MAMQLHDAVVATLQLMDQGLAADRGAQKESPKEQEVVAKFALEAKTAIKASYPSNFGAQKTFYMLIRDMKVGTPRTRPVVTPVEDAKPLGVPRFWRRPPQLLVQRWQDPLPHSKLPDLLPPSKSTLHQNQRHLPLRLAGIECETCTRGSEPEAQPTGVGSPHGLNPQRCPTRLRITNKSRR